jgi:uncharacterized protein (TIGR02246 family)
MRWNSRGSATLTLAVAAIMVGAGFIWMGRSPADDAGDKTREAATSTRAAAYITAFNHGDASACAAFWAADGSYVDQAGREYKGREAIEKLYQKTFAARKGAKLAIHITSRKLVSPDVVVEDGITEITTADRTPATVARFSAVLVKKGDAWLLHSVRDAIAHPPSHARHLEGLEWLIGHWAGEAEKGESAQASYEWAENQNFIVSSFATTVDGAPVAGGTQWIGWDAADKKIRSWSFYAEGGFGEATWTHDGNRWTLKTTAKLANGKKVSATNIVTRVDDDHLTWQMTKLTVDGEEVPDHKPVKMKRVRPEAAR